MKIKGEGRELERKRRNKKGSGGGKDCTRPSPDGRRPARMRAAALNLCRCLLALLVVLPGYSSLRAQKTDEAGQFYFGFAGSAVFPYDPKGQSSPGGEGINFAAGAGFTTAFGYAFKEGFSTEIEWGYQKVGIGNPTGNLSLASGWQASAGRFDGVTFTDFEGFEPPSIPSIAIAIDGEIKTQSLMGNFYYRYPKWRVSPYVGFGLGAFFHDGTVTSTITVEPGPLPPGGLFLGLPAGPLTVRYEDSRFAYQIMVGLSARVSKRVEFRFGYRFRSSRGEPIDADQIEAGVWFRL